MATIKQHKNTYLDPNVGQMGFHDPVASLTPHKNTYLDPNVGQMGFHDPVASLTPPTPTQQTVFPYLSGGSYVSPEDIAGRQGGSFGLMSFPQPAQGESPLGVSPAAFLPQVQAGQPTKAEAPPPRRDLFAELGLGATPPQPSAPATFGHQPSPVQMLPTGGTATSTWSPSGERPELAPGEDYVAPEYDEARVRSIARRIAAPELMRQRRDLMTTIAQSGRYFGNPLARAEATRRALQGYGIGVASTLGQAEQAGRAQYQAEFQTKVHEAMQNWQQQNQERMAMFNSAMQEYLRSGTQTTETTKTYASKGSILGASRQEASPNIASGYAPAGGYRVGRPGAPI
jgi:hypothetical protein